MVEVIKQRQWTKKELRAEGFSPYERRKEVVMVRELPKAEAPMTIITDSGDKLVAQAGTMICYSPGDQVRPTLNDYDHWPVAPDIFRQTYRVWDEWDWILSAPEKHLINLGCKPYYKAAPVWAKKLEKPVYLQSLEQKNPGLVKEGHYVVIGAKGEPYSVGDNTFIRRYYQRGFTALWQRIQHLLKTEEQ